MDTEIGNPVEYNPQLPLEDTREEPEPPRQYYFPPPHMMMPPPMESQPVKNSGDFLANLDKTAYLVIFAAFILGFFMGKTMQPVILRHG